jgi:rRNA maturation RNase YbeY
LDQSLYLPDIAHQKMQTRRQHAKQPFMSVSLSTIKQLKQRLEQYHSPEQICGALNRDYRHKDAPTDVLAFAALEAAMVLPPDLLQSDPLYLGDIIVSLDTARRQSAAHGHTWQEEVLWLTAHGFLHLLGWDHPDEAALQRMWQQQQQLLAVVGMSLPTSAYAQAAG